MREHLIVELDALRCDAMDLANDALDGRVTMRDVRASAEAIAASLAGIIEEVKHP